MKTLADVYIDLSVVLGTSTMPIHQLLRMGRGAIIELEATEHDDAILIANDVPIAKARVMLTNDRISVEVVEMLSRGDITN